MLVSLRSWWCQPDTAPGSVTTRPAHSVGTSNARSLAMPGVGSAGTVSDALTTRTGSLMPTSLPADVSTMHNMYTYCV